MSTLLPGDVPGPQKAPDAQWSASLEELAPGVTTLLVENRSESENWADTLARLLPALAATWQQKQLLDVQVERARNGLAPLDASQYAPGVKVGLAPETQRLLMWGGIAALAIFAFASMRRR